MKAEEIIAQFPLPKSGRQKFRQDVKRYARQLGYCPASESGTIRIGDPINADYLLSCGTAASGVAAWLEILRTFPENQRHKVCFLLFDDKADISAYRMRYGVQSPEPLLIHLDHVGDGKHMRFVPAKGVKANKPLVSSFYRVCGYFGERDLLVEDGRKPFLLKTYPCFPYAVTVCSRQTHKKRLRYPHKTKNTLIDNTNVNILRAALTTFICCDEVN